MADRSIREIQTALPWTIRYSRDHRANPQTHKDFAHALHHVSKAAGKLHALADDMDHDREVADDPTLRDRHAKYVADLVVCALRIANVFPGGVIDLQGAVECRIREKNSAPKEPQECPPNSPSPSGASAGTPTANTAATPNVQSVGPASNAQSASSTTPAQIRAAVEAWRARRDRLKAELTDENCWTRMVLAGDHVAEHATQAAEELERLTMLLRGETELGTLDRNRLVAALETAAQRGYQSGWKDAAQRASKMMRLFLRWDEFQRPAFSWHDFEDLCVVLANLSPEERSLAERPGREAT